MPAYNEETTVTRAVAEILGTDYPCDIELIVVDDGSTDGTALLLSLFRDDRLIVHRHPVNQGKGAALRSAAALATGTHLLPFDADLEYAAEDIPRLLEPVLRGRCDVVYGSRLFGCNTVYQSYRYALGNRLLTTLTNILFNANLSDLHTCLKLMPAAVVKEFSLNEIGFGLDTEVTTLLLLRGIRPFEVPVSYYSRSHAQGKKINWRDAIKCLWILLRMRLRGRRYRGPGPVGPPGPPEGDRTAVGPAEASQATASQATASQATASQATASQAGRGQTRAGQGDAVSLVRWVRTGDDLSPGVERDHGHPAGLVGPDDDRAAETRLTWSSHDGTGGRSAATR